MAEESKLGRPEIPIDPKMVEGLASIHCTIKEIAAALDCSEDTISRRFQEEIARGKEKGKVSLRRHLWDLVKKGDRGATIFLAKNLLNYRDGIALEHTNPDGSMRPKIDFKSLPADVQGKLVEFLKDKV